MLLVQFSRVCSRSNGVEIFGNFIFIGLAVVAAHEFLSSMNGLSCVTGPTNVVFTTFSLVLQVSKY